ncbi:hypothetical protein M885DRAFT_563560 [Pelagophyceae sp. CCMP2097]|nr:hypothetical protein M885DRAFT_563560 [Pelagophyceae sp. CCMP2097]
MEEVPDMSVEALDEQLLQLLDRSTSAGWLKSMEFRAQICRMLAVKLPMRPKALYKRGAEVVRIRVASSAAIVGLLQQRCAKVGIPETSGVPEMVFRALVDCGMLVHVGRGPRSIEAGLGQRDKKKISRETYYWFDYPLFAPYELHVHVIAVRGLPAAADASAVVSFCGQFSVLDEVAVVDDDRPAPLGEDSKEEPRPERRPSLRRSGGVEGSCHALFGLQPDEQACAAAFRECGAALPVGVAVEWNNADGSYSRAAGTVSVALTTRARHKLFGRTAPAASTQGRAVPCDLIWSNGGACAEGPAARRGSWRPLAPVAAAARQGAPAANVQVLVLAHVTPRLSTVERRDLEAVKWRVYAHVHSVAGAQSGVLIPTDFLRSQVVLEVVASVQGVEACSKPVAKDFRVQGAAFQERLALEGAFERRHAHLKLAVYERLKTDLTRTRRLGYVKVPLADVPLVFGLGCVDALPLRVAALNRPPLKVDLCSSALQENGTVTFVLAMRPLLPASAPFLETLHVALLFAVVWAYSVSAHVVAAVMCWQTSIDAFVGAMAFVLMAPLFGAWALLEAPQLLGRGLTAILALTVPSLRLSVDSIRIVPSFQDLHRSFATSAQDAAQIGAGATRRLVVGILVDGMRIGNPKGSFTHANFVAADRVRFQVSFDRRFTSGVLVALGDYARAKWRRAPGDKAPRLINWDPFPSQHARLRDSATFEPTRLGVLRFEVIYVGGATITFNQDSADGEFNICRFVRGLAEDKVRGSLWKDEAAPNTMRVRVVAARGFGTIVRPCVVLKIRDCAVRTPTRPPAESGEAWWNETFTLGCPDPAAVLHVALHNDSPFARNQGLVGQWIVTAKMLCVAPTNVFGDELEARHDARGFALRGRMATAASFALRDANFCETDCTLVLDILYYYDPTTKSVVEALRFKPKTALVQLTENSAETRLRVGCLATCRAMLAQSRAASETRQARGCIDAMHAVADFPLLFDVKAAEVTQINFYLKELFMGSRGTGDTRGQQIHRRLKEEYWQSRRAGNAPDHFFMQRLDFRRALEAPRSSPEGIDLYWLFSSFVVQALRPLARPMNLGGAVGQVLAGVFAGAHTHTVLMSLVPKPSSLKSVSAAARAVESAGTLYKERLQRCVEERRLLRSKYVNEQDAAALAAPPLFSGRLQKRVRRPSTLRLGLATRTTPWVRVQCDLRLWHGRRTLYYTKFSSAGDAAGGFRGATKKAAVNYARVDGDTLAIEVVADSSCKRKVLCLRASSNAEADAWWFALVRHPTRVDACVDASWTAEGFLDLRPTCLTGHDAIRVHAPGCGNWAGDD